MKLLLHSITFPFYMYHLI